jgi:hypothetical protein
LFIKFEPSLWIEVLRSAMWIYGRSKLKSEKKKPNTTPSQQFLQNEMKNKTYQTSMNISKIQKKIVEEAQFIHLT